VHVASATRHFSYPCTFSVRYPVTPMTNNRDQARRGVHNADYGWAGARDLRISLAREYMMKCPSPL
jgi:hypothetical protein